MSCRTRIPSWLVSVLACATLCRCVDPVVISSYPETPEEIERTLQHCGAATVRVAWTVKLDDLLGCQGCAAKREMDLLAVGDVVLASSSGPSVGDPVAVSIALSADGNLLWRDVPGQESSTETGGLVQRVTLSKRDDAHAARFWGADYRCVLSGCARPEELPPSRMEVVELATGAVVDSLTVDRPADRVYALADGVLVRTKSETSLTADREAARTGLADVATLVNAFASIDEPWTRRFEGDLAHVLATPNGDLVVAQSAPPRVTRLDTAGTIVFYDGEAVWPPPPEVLGYLGFSQSDAPQLAADDQGHTLATMSNSVVRGTDVRTHVIMRKYDPLGEILWQRVVISHDYLPEARAVLTGDGAYLAVAQQEGDRLRNQLLRVDAAGDHCRRFTVEGPEQTWDRPPDCCEETTPQLIRELAAGPPGAFYFHTGDQLGRIDVADDEPTPP